MKIDQLQLQNYRKFEELTIDLHPKFTMLVGSNGSGKTTVIDALAMGVNMWLGNLPPRGGQFGVRTIGAKDVRKIPVKVGDRIQFEERFPAKFLLTGQIGDEITITWGQSFESEARLSWNQDKLASQAAQIYSGEKSTLLVNYPVFAFYGVTRAALPENQQPPSLRLNAVSRWDAYSHWFNPRIDYDDLRSWFFSESAAAGENGGHRRPGYEVVRQVVLDCIPGADNIWFSVDERDIVCSIDGQAQPLRNLSDGQRMLLAMVADIAVKAVTLNAHLLPADKLGPEDKPLPRLLQQTPGVVLIDELDVHLHPSWQRRVTADLKRTFPAIQFVCTSHSPQVIGELAREEIKLLRPEGVESPSVARGADSNWILDHVMEGSASENVTARQLKDEAEEALAEGNLPQAHAKLEAFRRLLDGDTGELVRLESSLYTLEALAEDVGEGENA